MKITIKEPYRNAGYSLGLKYPLIYGKTPLGWCVWDRHTGVVAYRAGKSSHFRMAERACQTYAETHNPGYGDRPLSPFEYDSVS